MFGLSGEKLALRRNQQPKAEAHLLFFFSFSFLNLGGKVGFRPGMGIAALDLGFSAWVVTVPTPGDRCLEQQDSPHWTPWKPGEHNKPASGRPASFNLG